MALTARRGALGPLCSPGRYVPTRDQTVAQRDALYLRLRAEGKPVSVALAEAFKAYPDRA